MVQSVIVYSEIIPTILAIFGLYFIITGVLDEKRNFLAIGLLLFLLAIVVPFIILTNMI
jgi:hypothetical protein